MKYVWILSVFFALSAFSQTPKYKNEFCGEIVSTSIYGIEINLEKGRSYSEQYQKEIIDVYELLNLEASKTDKTFISRKSSESLVEYSVSLTNNSNTKYLLCVANCDVDMMRKSEGQDFFLSCEKFSEMSFSLSGEEVDALDSLEFFIPDGN